MWGCDMFDIEVWNERDYLNRDEYTNSVDIVVDDREELQTLIDILINSGNVFTVRRLPAVLTKE